MMLRTLINEFEPTDKITVVNKHYDMLFMGTRNELIHTIGDKFLNLRCRKVELSNGYEVLQVVPRFRERWLNG